MRQRVRLSYARRRLRKPDAAPALRLTIGALEPAQGQRRARVKTTVMAMMHNYFASARRPRRGAVRPDAVREKIFMPAPRARKQPLRQRR
jgi:hypothetical protein